MTSLINAAEMARSHPDTFQRPPDDVLAALRPGDFAKLAASGERFWVRIERADFPHFCGRDEWGRIDFHADNVFDVEGCGA